MKMTAQTPNNTQIENDLMSMGLNLGVFIIAELMSEGIRLTPRGWEMMKNHVAKEAERICGMPAEDFASLASKQLDYFRKMADKNSEED